MHDQTEPSPPRDDRAAAGDALWLRLAGALAALLGVTGLGLLFVYRPGPEAASSLVALREVGRLAALRDLHHWVSHGLLIVAFLALTRAFVLGEDRDRRRWLGGVTLFAVAVLGAFTGWLLAGRLADPLVVYAVHVAVLPLIVGAVVLALRRSGGSTL